MTACRPRRPRRWAPGLQIRAPVGVGCRRGRWLPAGLSDALVTLDGRLGGPVEGWRRNLGCEPILGVRRSSDECRQGLIDTLPYRRDCMARRNGGHAQMRGTVSRRVVVAEVIGNVGNWLLGPLRLPAMIRCPLRPAPARPMQAACRTPTRPRSVGRSRRSRSPGGTIAAPSHSSRRSPVRRGRRPTATLRPRPGG